MFVLVWVMGALSVSIASVEGQRLSPAVGTIALGYGTYLIIKLVRRRPIRPQPSYVVPEEHSAA